MGSDWHDRGMEGKEGSRLSRFVRGLPRPTVLGGGYLVATAVLGITAEVQDHAALRLLFGLLLAGALLSAVIPALNLRGLSFEREPPATVHAGQVFEVGARVIASGRTSASFSVVLTDGPNGPFYRPGHAVALRVAPGEPADLRYRVRIKDRGRHRIEEAALTTRYPFGLFEHRVTLPVESEIVAFPRLGSFSKDPLPASGFTRLMTSTETAREKGQEEFGNLREYRPGDNTRLIAWRASARHGELMVKELEDDLSKRVTVFLESRLPAGARRSRQLRLERAISFAATLIRALARRRYRVRLYYFGPDPMEVAAQRGGRHMNRMMESLAVLKPTPVGGIHNLVSLAPDEVIATSRSVLVVPSLDRERLVATMARFPRRRQPVIYRADGAWERSLFRTNEEAKNRTPVA